MARRVMTAHGNVMMDYIVHKTSNSKRMRKNKYAHAFGRMNRR